MKGHREPAAFRFGRCYTQLLSGCWQWDGAVNNKGYGTFNPAPSVKVYAHRFAYEFAIGPVPEGLELDHLCRNTLCVNPWHLEPVTRAENMRRMAEVVIGDTCIAGHLLAGANIYRPPSRPNNRVCRTCMRERARARKRRQAQASQGLLPPQ